MNEFNDFADRSLRPSNPLMVRHYTDSQGKARIQGGKALKASQSYPMKCFGSIKRYVLHYGAMFAVVPNEVFWIY